MSLAGSRTVVFEQDTSLRYVWYYSPFVSYSLVGKTDKEAFVAEDAAVLEAVKRRALAQGERVHQELAVTAGGKRRQYREVVEPIRNCAGDVVGIIGSATDVSEEKETQRQLREALGLRDQMMGILGHDLRNPLNAVSMAASALVRRPDLPEDMRAKVQVIQRAAGRMTELIESLLELARVGSISKMGLSPAPLDLGALARELVDEERAACPERSIELDVRGNLQGEWDPSRLAQVLSNLVSNALSHGDPRAPVWVSLDGERAEVTLRVKNEGSPIPPGLLPVLFEPFVRKAGDASHGGLGLGLYIVKQIVVGHGGTVGVESTAQAGTTFTVRLPRSVHRS
jgi:signal transduction histidine kinase